MKQKNQQASLIQSRYYQNTAADYDKAHLLEGDPEHQLALHFLSGLIDQYSIQSVLDIGAGTGRTLGFLKSRHSGLKVVGIEPVAELRAVGHSKGIPPDELIEGNGNDLNFLDASFDLVCEFAVLHHVSQPSKVLEEMLRVSKRFVFVSDCNNYGQGGVLARTLKFTLRTLGLWRLFDYARTRGKGYHISEGDGLFYSYSVFDNAKQMKRECERLHFLGTAGSGSNLLLSARHVAMFGVKNDLDRFRK